MSKIQIEELDLLARTSLLQSGAIASVADATAEALVYADIHGLHSHGVARLPMYCAQLKNGRVDGKAIPTIINDKGAAFLVDAANGLAYSACKLAINEAIHRAQSFGTSVVSITRSHHFGAGAYHLEAVGQAGLVGFAFSNAPASMPAIGGNKPLFGTNPIAAIFPRKNSNPIIIDLSLSEVARGKIMIAARENKRIPEGWAVTKEGLPTTDPKAALEGMMLPFGGSKGAILALMVELLAVSLSGARFGAEAGSFLVADGPKSEIGHLFWVIDPNALGGIDTYYQRIETLIDMMLEDSNVRLPGARRLQIAENSQIDGIEINADLLEEINLLCL